MLTHTFTCLQRRSGAPALTHESRHMHKVPAISPRKFKVENNEEGTPNGLTDGEVSCRAPCLCVVKVTQMTTSEFALTVLAAALVL